MGIFSRSPRTSHRNRHSTGTASTLDEPGYNNGVTSDNSYGSRRQSRRLGRRNRGSHMDRGHKDRRGLFDIDSGYYNRRPSFGTWFKYTWLDILTMVAMGAIGLGVYEANPAPSRSFPVTFSDGQIVYPQFAYPLRHEIVPIWLAALLASLIPIFIILCMQIRIRSFWDVNNAVIGLLYSLIGAAVFQVFVKWLIGGLRPHFLDVCQPDLSKVLSGGNGYQNIMFTSDICTGDRNQINDSLESMPSGHSTAAWAGFLYLYFYLNGKMKVFSNHHPAMWKLIALYAPVLGATLITGTLTIDEFHNWYDCLAGAIIGSVFAISAYRMVYASVWDFRFNHIPLTRHTPFSYGAGAAGAGGFETAVFTRAGGWGYEEAYGGAPFDSAFTSRGAGGSGAITSSQHTTGLGDKNTGHRVGDIEHNAATGYGRDHRHHDHNVGVGVGHNNYNDGSRHHHGLGHHHDRDRGAYPNSTSYTAPTGMTEPATAHNNTLSNRDHNTLTDRDHNNNFMHRDHNNTLTDRGANTLTGRDHNNNTLTDRDRDRNDTFMHRDHNNTFTGRDQSNTLTDRGQNTLADRGQNTLTNRDRNNNLTDRDYNDTLTGRDHNDTFTGRGDNNTFTGRDHNNPLTGRDHNNPITGRENNTTFTGRDNSNTFTGRDNNNTFMDRDGGYSNDRDDFAREGRTSHVGDGRYSSNRKSLERKAIGNTTGRNEGFY